MRDHARTTRGLVGQRPLYYTEWSTLSNPRDPLHDEPYAAAVVIKTMLEARGLVDSYSWWTFSDLFEENYFPSAPFQGGFGLLTIYGIPKPSYRAFELLHCLGTEVVYAMEDVHPTVDAWVVRQATGRAITIMLTNHALPRHPILTQLVHIRLTGGSRPAAVSVRRIDGDHANPKARWLALGAPRYLSREQVGDLRDASLLAPHSQPWTYEDGVLCIDVQMPPHAVAAITVDLPAPTPAGELPTSLYVIKASDDAVVEELERRAFTYFLHEVDHGTGLVRDNTRPGAPASVAGSGFALACYVVGAERGYVSRSEAASLCRAALRFLWQGRQGEHQTATGVHGLFYHFLAMETGQRVWDSEVSTIDSAIALAGVLTAGRYFDRESAGEREIRELAEAIYRRVDWQWATGGGRTVSQGWRPESGFLPCGWHGYTEAVLLYVLGSARQAIRCRPTAMWPAPNPTHGSTCMGINSCTPVPYSSIN